MKIGLINFHDWDQQHFDRSGRRVANIGDSIREAVMMDIVSELNNVDDLVFYSQKELGRYSGEKIRVLFDDMINDNEIIDNIINNECVEPVFVSCFFYDDIFAGHPERVAYFKSKEPIGCRDEHSKDLCLQNGIEAFLVGCFSICLNGNREGSGEQIYIVDVDERMLEFIPKEIKENAIYRTHSVEVNEYPITQKESQRLLKCAREILEEYRKNAKLIISGRLHATIPPLAMGIPTIIMNENYNYKFGWVDKWLNLNDFDNVKSVNYGITLDEKIKKEIDCVSKGIRANIAYAIDNGQNSRSLLLEIDSIYMHREKTELNKYYKRILNEDLKQYERNDSFSYGIWGCGLNGGYVYQIMKELYPNAKLAVMVDKYKEGMKYGVKIIKGIELNDYSLDHIIIASAPAIPEAVRLLKNCGLYKDHFSITVTKQTS